MRKLTSYLMPIVLLASLVLTACGGAASQKPTDIPATQADSPTDVPAVDAPTAEPTREPVTIKLLNYSQERVDFYKDVAQEFNKEYPWITIQWDTMTEDDYAATLPLLFKGGNAPDIFLPYGTQTDYSPLPEMLNSEWVQPLDDAALPADFRSRFPGTFNLKEGIYSKDGKIYAIPRVSGVGPIGFDYMYYNKELVAQAGVAIPKTWDEFHAACKTIKEKTKAYCMAVPTVQASEINRLMFGFFPFNGKGGWNTNWISPETGKFTYLSDPSFVETLEYLRGLYKENLVMPGSNDKVFARQAMSTGLAAFYFDGGWMSQNFPITFEYPGFGVAAPPAKEATGYTGKIPSGPPPPDMFISIQSKHPYEATLFLEWMTRPEGWYTKSFLAKGFDALPWADNEKYITDPGILDLVKLDPQVHVVAPVPALKCPDLSKSKAMDNADGIHPNSEYEAIIDYLQNGGDWMKTAKAIEDAKNKVFEDTLKEEAAKGLKVSTDCFAEPTWNGLTTFDYSVYGNQ